MAAGQVYGQVSVSLSLCYRRGSSVHLPPIGPHNISNYLVYYDAVYCPFEHEDALPLPKISVIG